MDEQRRENLGPADQVVKHLLTYKDHLVHNRAGMVVPDRSTVTGVRWVPVTSKLEGGETVIYELQKVGGKSTRVRRGTLRQDGKVVQGATVLGEYRKPTRGRVPGTQVQPETATYWYKQIAAVYAMDQEFVARWASWAFEQSNLDQKVALAAFLLVQPRKGAPVKEGGEVLFHDVDYRDVGEAICLISRKKEGIDAKLLLRIGKFLRIPGVADINRTLGYTASKKPYLGRWPSVVCKWLSYREQNPRMLEGLVKAGFRTTVQQLARESGFKPSTENFYRILQWKQQQAPDGRRKIGLDLTIEKTSWAGLSEKEICQAIQAERPSWKVVVGRLGTAPLTRAILASAVEAGSMSNADMLLLTPTLEEYGMLEVPSVKARWDAANAAPQTNQRTANIAKNVKGKELAEKLQDTASKAVAEVAKKAAVNVMLYVFVDVSGSMTGSIPRAVEFLSRFIGGWPLENLQVFVFDTHGREVRIQHASKAGVQHAFAAFGPGGGTDYGAPIRAITRKPKEGQQAFLLFVGDNDPDTHRTFETELAKANLNPLALGLLEVGQRLGQVVDRTAQKLNIPVLRVDHTMFNTEDPYAVVTSLRALISAGTKTLVDEILNTPLLVKPAWARGVHDAR